MTNEEKLKLAQAAVDAVSSCPEFKEVAGKYIDAVGTQTEKEFAKYLVAEAQEDICSIDNTIEFMQTDMAKEIFGAETAKEKAEHAKAVKAAGGLYCDCPGCTAAKAIIDAKDELIK